MEGPTGNRRYRVQRRLFRRDLVVLQLEFRVWDDPASGNTAGGRWGTLWVDALPEDLLEKPANVVPFPAIT